MKILHLSDYGLPDWRIEKCARSGTNHGHQVFFAGLKSSLNNNTFSLVYNIDWTPRARRAFPYHWHCVKKQLKRIVMELKPDIVHAHNIFSAKMISELDMPLVYDDHEFWPSYVERQIESYVLGLANSKTNYTARSLIRRILLRLLNRRYLQLGLKWEKELASSTPTVTVSETIASEIRRLGGTKVFVTPNFPMKEEIENLESPKFYKELSSVYVGLDTKSNNKIVHRNMDGLVDIFNLNNDAGTLTMIGIDEPINDKNCYFKKNSSNVIYREFLPRHLMYQEMQYSSIGLVPFRRHWSHRFISPNKAYEYAHAGLLVICSSSFTTIKKVLNGHCITFEDYEDLKSKLRYCKNNIDEIYQKRKRVFRFAKENLIWEKYEQNIFDAYKLA